jgi:hypothetical protein
MKKPYTLEDFFEIMKLFCKEGEKVRGQTCRKKNNLACTI